MQTNHQINKTISHNAMTQSLPLTLKPARMAKSVTMALLFWPMLGAAPAVWGQTACVQSQNAAGKPVSAYIANASCSADMAAFDSRGQNAAGHELVATALLVVGKENIGGVYKPSPSKPTGLVVDIKLDDRVYDRTGGQYTSSLSIIDNGANQSTINLTGAPMLTVKSKAPAQGHGIHNFGHEAILNITGLDYDHTSTGSDQYTYGLLAGSGSVDHMIVANNAPGIGAAKIVVGDATTLSNKAEVLKIKMKDEGPGNVNLINGIRAIQSQTSFGVIKGAYGVVEVNGNASIDLDGRQSVGIYVSGNMGAPAVLLNGDTSINIKTAKHSPAAGKFSAGILLGKTGRGDGEGTIEVGVVSKGKLDINVLATDDVAAILVDGENGTLNAGDAQASTVLQGNSHLIQIRGTGTNAALSFNNAQLVAGAGQEDVQKSLIAVEARATGVALAFKGEDSHLRARDQGYLIEVAEQAGASLALSAGAKMTGLTQKSAGGQLSVALDQAQWQLAANKRFTDAQAQASSFDELNMVNQSRLLAHDGANGAAAAYVLQGKVSNAGSAIELNNGVVGDVLTIDGDYHGDAGVVKMDTVWDAPGNVTGGQSQSDVLHITGAASGLTKVIPTDAHGKTILIKGTVKQVAERLNSVPVVIVDQDHDGEGRAGAQSMAFVGTAATEGMAEAQLYRDGNQYKWTLAAAEAPIPPVEPPKPVNPPTEPPVNPKPTILAPEVVGYAQMPYANMALSYAMAATLHERVSEQQSLAWDECGQCQDQVNSQTWARIVGQKLDVNGKQRMNQEGDLYLVQVGHDFDLSVNEQTGSRRHTGLMASYGRHELDFYDRLGAVNGVLAGTRYTGKGNTDAFSLGAYQTHYQASGAYLDLVGQVTYLRNKYESRDNINVSQNGWGGLVSAEVGRPYAVGSSAWLVEPQAQLMYQYLHLSDFHDGKRKVDQDDQQGLRGRLGVRLAHNQGSQAQRSRTVYAVANVWHDFLNAKGVSVGPDAYRERHQTTWGELGLGLQLPLGKQTYAYADARYEHALSGAKHQGYRGTLGMKYQWR